MNDFRLVLDNIDFGELVEFGRSMIPTYAPEWTDHNYHDPGIMLIELLAFVADAPPSLGQLVNRALRAPKRSGSAS